MKNDIKSLPLNTNKDSTTKGFIFICFIGLIIRMRLLNIMKEKEILKNYTVESLLMELEKIKKIELENGETIITLTPIFLGEHIRCLPIRYIFSIACASMITIKNIWFLNSLHIF